MQDGTLQVKNPIMPITYDKNKIVALCSDAYRISPLIQGNS